MEKPPSFKPSSPLPNLSAQDWDSLLDDFSSGDPSRRRKHLSLPLLDLSLHSLSRRDLPSGLKLSLLHFLDQHLPFIPLTSIPFPSLLSALRSFLPSPDPSPLKEQLVITTTSLFISLLRSPSSPHLQSLTELLLTLINRPNHGPDRQTRGLACESLRELESAFPCLLSEILGHVWVLAQSERTHVAQSYILLLAQISRNAVIHGLLSSTSSILSTSTPLTHFSIPQIALSDQRSILSPPPSDLNLREIRRVLAFLLDRPRELTPGAMSQLASTLVDIASALEECVPAVSALLKVNFSSLLSSYNPLLNHSILSLYHHFSDAFNDDDAINVAHRLQLFASDTGQRLIFRLLSLHWLFGSIRLAPQISNPSSLPGFYPHVFDPLAVKAKKLDAISFITSERLSDEGVSLLENGLVCVSSFKWLPGWSTETMVAFRSVHKLLIGVLPHDNGSGRTRLISLMESATFKALENMLVNLAWDHHVLVPVIASFISRLLHCGTHSPVGDTFLQTLDGRLLPNLKPGYGLSFYFPLLEKIAENETVNPKGVLELLMRHMVCLSAKHGPHTGHRSWAQGSWVLGICRVVLKNHNGSQVFNPLTRLLAFTCQHFPDLEVRDNARIYLRMLACIPGKKLRQTLTTAEKTSGLARSPLPASLVDVPSPRSSLDLKKKSTGISSYIHLERLTPPLVKLSWFLSLPGSVPVLSNGSRPVGGGIMDITGFSEKIAYQEKTLRVLKTHFGCIPDYRVMPGIKIRIPCILQFESDPFARNWGSESSSDELQTTIPALYATKITFSSFSKYGKKIAPCRVPFLLGEDSVRSDLALVVPVDRENDENTPHHSNNNFARVLIEFQPEDPMPGLINVSISANTGSGKIVSGSLTPVTISIEDMFLKPILPPDVSDERVPRYYSDLFDALWEACGGSSEEILFPLNGGKGAVAVKGTQSVKLLEVPDDVVVNAVERHLARFVVRVVGGPLVSVVRQNRIIENVLWEEKEEEEEEEEEGGTDNDVSAENALVVTYSKENNNNRSLVSFGKKKNIMGTICVLIFLPPRYHLLFMMEVGYSSTMVRIRTDHWPCLAYVDEYLEALM